MIILYSVSLLLIVYFLVEGVSFYLTDYQLRPRHEGYRNLRPAGDFGHGVGIIGSAMMLFMLLYSLRKRTRLFGKKGSLNRWLSVHIYFGIIGPLLVILHSSFKVQGLIAVSFWSMITVALSGVLGRYLYLQIPHDVEGENLSREEIDRLYKLLTAKTNGNQAIDDNLLSALESELSVATSENAGLFKTVWLSIYDDITAPIRIRKLRSTIRRNYAFPDSTCDQLIELTRLSSVTKRKTLMLNQLQQLFHYWHVFHKPFAIIMYLIMTVHIVVAVWLGYTWKF